MNGCLKTGFNRSFLSPPSLSTRNGLQLAVAVQLAVNRSINSIY